MEMRRTFDVFLFPFFFQSRYVWKDKKKREGNFILLSGSLHTPNFHISHLSPLRFSLFLQLENFRFFKSKMICKYDGMFIFPLLHRFFPSFFC